MKRATRATISESEVMQRGVVVSWPERRDILASDAKQRAEIRDLKARLAVCGRAYKLDLFAGCDGCDDEMCGACMVARASSLKTKDWRKP